MKNTSPAVDAYIARAPEFARPILDRIRAAFHAGCPQLEEKLKWGVPSFEYKGMLGGMAAFKAHVSFGFWKARLMKDFAATFGAEPAASAMRVRARSVAELPPRQTLVAFVKEAKRLNDEGVKEPRRAAKTPARRLTVPADLREALARNQRAQATFASLAPSHRRAYIDWITEAKREATRRERLQTTIAWLAEGKRRNWKYEKKARG